MSAPRRAAGDRGTSYVRTTCNASRKRVRRPLHLSRQDDGKLRKCRITLRGSIRRTANLAKEELGPSRDKGTQALLNPEIKRPGMDCRQRHQQDASHDFNNATI